jgi:hypothetical protein
MSTCLVVMASEAKPSTSARNRAADSGVRHSGRADGTFSTRPGWADGAPDRTGDKNRKQHVSGKVRLGPVVHFVAPFRIMTL